MPFMYIHTLPVEKCLADKPEQVRQMSVQVMEAMKRAGAKMIGVYAAAHEHTIYIIFEADNIAAVEQALVPMTTWGDARLIPVVTMEQMFQQQ